MIASILLAAALALTPAQSYTAASAACAAMPIRSTGTKIYVCDCQTGAESGCTDGNTAANDTNPGTDPALPKRTWAAAIGAFNALPAGGTVALCKGGAFNVLTSINARNANCSGAADMTAAANTTTCDLRDYAPPWGGTARPKVNAAASSVNAFTSGTNAWPTGNGSAGVRILNLDFQGGGSGPGGTSYGNYAVWIFGNQGPYLICNNVFNAWGIGVNTQLLAQHAMTGIDIWGNRFTESTGQGALVMGSNSKIDSNYFDRNGSTTIYDHSVYLTAHTGATNFSIINNEMRFTGATVCAGNVIVVHGNTTNLNIENNVLDGGAQPGNGCWGMSVDRGGYTEVEGFINTTIRRNWIQNVGNAGIATDSDAGTIIENNVLVLGTADSRGIYYTRQAANAGDTTSTGTIVRNNTIYNGSASVTNAYGIQGGVAEGSGRVIANNSVFYANATGRCFSTPGVAGDYTFVGNNACYQGTWTTTFDATTHVTANPLYTNAPTDFTPAAGSPLVNVGSNTYKAATDFNGTTRSATPDIGALEQAELTIIADPPVDGFIRLHGTKPPGAGVGVYKRP